MFIWTDDLATGNKFIDDQHKEIFKRADALLSLNCDGESNKEEVMGLFKFLVSYVFEHFSSEETLMRNHDYEHYDDHKEHHAAFLKKTAVANSMLKEHGVNQEFLDELKLLIIELLVDHIHGHDKKLATAIQEKTGK